MPMEVTRRASLAILILFALAITARTVRLQKNATAQSSDVERGEYLVNEVAKCQECHTPRDAGGNLDYSRDLQGAPVWIVPVHADTKWSNRAPAIAGLPGLSDAQAQTILEKGIAPNGLAIQPPMHAYHMSHADATAIIAYLRSMSSAYPRQ